MGVYIKGIEIPKDNTALLRIYPKDKLNELYVEQLDIDGDTLNEYWAVPVPPHGRLIDADVLLNNKGVGTQIAGWGKMFHETAIEYAPTIIPAEEGET